jgi:Methylase involved in ubiquinone/menaquinone biosynthesis
VSGIDAGVMLRFREAYAAQRAVEGRAYARDALLALPYIHTGPLARQWAVRSRTFDAFVRSVLAPMMASSTPPLRLLDLGAGNGWLASRAALAGCEGIAVDLRDDAVDGLGAGAEYVALSPGRMRRVVGSFESIPLGDATVDVVVFNASLHYALDLAVALHEARRVMQPRGRIVILDSPFYRRVSEGEAMVREKRASASALFGKNAEALLALPSIEYLTRETLVAASATAGIRWTRHRVRYPLWYEARALNARVRGHRTPSRFDLWEGALA